MTESAVKAESKTAIIFPGQGSQKVGMGHSLIEKYPQVKSLFDMADSVLGRSLSRTIFEGPMAALTDTRNAQPAIFLVSMAMYAALKDAVASGTLAGTAESLTSPVAVAGHSLGEISAYVAAGVLTMEDGLRIINKRASAMADAYPSDNSAMTAVMGMEADTIQVICESVWNEKEQKSTGSESNIHPDTVVVANYNCPGQIVISGTVSGVAKASEALKSEGAKLIPLPVSGAFHSPLMAKAAKELADLVSTIPFSDAKCPVILNRTAKPETKAAALKENLAYQVIASVLWIDSIHTLSEMATTVIECGPGKVLTGLGRKINRELDIQAASDLLEVS